jgi:hypothetical protein
VTTAGVERPADAAGNASAVSSTITAATQTGGTGDDYGLDGDLHVAGGPHRDCGWYV